MKMVNVSYVVIDTSSGTKWSVDEDGKRKLCDDAPSTPKHILSGFKLTLSQGW